MKQLLFAFTLLCSFQALGFQSTGTLSGYVREAKTDIPIPGATVKVLDTSLGGITSADGYFKIENVPTQSFTVQASFVGYQSESKFNVVVRSGGTPDLIFLLKEEVNELEDVVVTASPFTKSEITPVSIQNLSREEIATYPGGNNDIAKVVQSLPGVAGSIGGFRNDIIIRGGAPNENVYYLDGIEIPNINHFATQGSAGGPVGLLNVSFFEGVDLATSSFGAQYDNVLSGVLQFDQRDGNNRENKTNIRVSSSEAALTLEGPILKGNGEASKTSYIASVRRSYLQLLFQAIGLPFLPDYWDYQYKVTHKFDDYNELIVTGVGSIDDFSINALEEFDPEQQASQDQVPVIKQETNTIGVSYKNRFKIGAGFQTFTLSTNRLENDFKQYEDNVNETGLFLNNVSSETETKFRYAYTRFLNQWTINTGLSFQRVNYTNQTLSLIPPISDFSQNLEFNRYGFFGQANRTFNEDRISLSIGFRTDGNNFTENGEDLLAQLSPRISASFILDAQRKWSLNASIGRYFKIPPYTILGYTDTNGTLLNQTADYIQSDHAVIGLEYLIKSAARITLEGFYKGYSNYPVSLTNQVSLANLGADFSVLGNEPISSVGEGRSYGMEFMYQEKLSTNYYAILAYTLYWSEFTGLNNENFLPSAWDSRHLITFTGGYQFGKNWELSARMRYLGSSPFAPVDQNETLNNYPAIILDYENFGTTRLDAFNQTDIRIDKKWNYTNWTLNVFLEIQNAFGQNTPQPPTFGLARTETGSIITPRDLIQIQELDNSSVLPSIGIVIDF